MEIKAFFDPNTWTLTYVVFDPETKDAVLIDPVLDYDPVGVAISTESFDDVEAFVKEQGLTVHWSIDTHAHADHLSGSQLAKERLGAKLAIGEHIQTVQDFFKGVFDMPELPADGSQWDQLLADGGSVTAGTLTAEAIYTPGHTPACITVKIGDAIFTGDAMFMPDFGTGRCDFPKGSASDLYDSIKKLYALPDETRVFVGHDYQPGGRELAYETTIGECKRSNKQLRADTDKEQFVTWRSERDATLKLPKLIFQSIQVNIDAGTVPGKHDNGLAYLKLPLNVFS